MKILEIIILVIALLYVVAGFIITFMTFKQTYRAIDIDMLKPVAHWDFYQENHRRREVSFMSGKNRLKGHVYEADHPKGLIVFSHGIWSGEEEYLIPVIWFVDHGWTVLAYNYTSYNGSEGKWAKGLPQSPLDLEAALSYVDSDEKINQLKRVVMGHSWGAFATTAVLSKVDRIDGAVAFSGFSVPVQIAGDVAAKMLGTFGRSYCWCIRLFDLILFGKEANKTAVKGINSTAAPVLLIHGVNDGFINFKTSSIIAHKDEITNPNVETIILDDPVLSEHGNYFTDLEGTLYYKRTEDKMKTMSEEEKKEYRKTVDLELANQPNTELFEKVEEFLERKVL